MYTGNWIKLYAPVTGLLLLLIALPRAESADDISAFQITNTEGFIGLRYRHDGDLTQQASSPESKEMRSVFEQELHLDTYGYVYHPNLLNVNIGAGVLLSQENLQTGSGTAEHDDTLYELSARLMFLEKKPYPLTLYYIKSHPSVALDVADVFIQENEKYGMNFSLRKPVSPVTLSFEAYKQSNKGNSFTQVVNDRNAYHSVTAHSDFDNGAYAELSYSENQQQSQSGSVNVSIVPFNVTSKTTDFKSLSVLGKQREINLKLTAKQTIQEEDRDLDETRFSPVVTWKHSKNFNSYYRYSSLDRKQANIETSDRAAAAGLRYEWQENLYSNAEAHINKNKTSGLLLDSYGVNGAVTYKHKLDFGLLQFNVALNYDDFNREAASVVQVVDANYTLTGSNSVTLAHDYIDTATIVVKRADTNQVLTEGLGNDYVVTVIGKQTLIQKVNPALPVNLDVLVSYQYNPGGTASFTSTGQSYQTSLEFNKYYTAYINYRNREQNLKSGLPSLPLGSSDTTSYGLRVSYALPSDVEVILGGDMLNEKHNENISSYQKKNLNLFMKMALPFSSNMNLSFTRQQVDNLSSTEDVDLTRYALRLKSHPANRLVLSLLVSDEKDTGSSLSRHSRNIALTGQWRIRKLLLELGARKINNMHGTTRQERTIFNLNLRRDF